MERDHKLDFLRALAIIGVLVIHSVGRYADSELEYIIGRWPGLVARACIAIFLFVSGVLFKQDQDISYLKHRIKRVLYPYLFFSVFALIYTYQANFANLEDIRVVLFQILTGGTFNIYFFVFVIICSYLVVFILDKSGILRKHITSLLLISLIINLLHAAYFRQLFDFFDIEDKFKDYYYLRTLLIWLPFYLFGVYYRLFALEKTILENKVLIRVVWVFIVFFYSFLYFIKIGNIGVYDSVIGTIYSLATILFLLTFNIKSKILYFISKTSYSMYLSHIFFVYALRDTAPLLWTAVPFWLGLISFVLSFIGSLCVYYLAKLVFKSKSFYIIGT
jgi:fucose 4-O-acetylase-like acetyltransferase